LYPHSRQCRLSIELFNLQYFQSKHLVEYLVYNPLYKIHCPISHMYSQLVLIFYLETVKFPLVPGLLSQWVPEVSLDRCILSARCVSVLILCLCSTTGPLLINLLFTFDEDRTISTNVTNVPAEIKSYLPSYLWFIVESGM
jgi:hypothetical protein